MANRDRSILIIGAGYMQLPAIRAARRLGLTVIVADGSKEAPGRAEADDFLHIDLKALDEMAVAARRLQETRGLAAVFTAGTDFSATVSYVAEAAGLPGTPYENALLATDKFRMREVLRSAGVRVPDFSVVSRTELDQCEGGLPERVTRLRLPVVVKPADSMGGRGVVRADDWRQALHHARTAVQYSRTDRVVIEGFIPGPEFSLDALIYGDTVQVTGFADRHIEFEPFFIEVGHTIPSCLGVPERELLEQEFVRGVRALGLGPGAAKGDMKLSPDGPVVGEIANRLSGGYMSGWTYPYSSGVPLSELGIRVALGAAPGPVRPTRDWTSAERAIVSIPGRIKSLSGSEEASRLASVEDVIATRGPGDYVRFPQNNVEKAGNVITAAAKRDVAIRQAERAVASIFVRLSAGEATTQAFLFEPVAADARHWAFPDAHRRFHTLVESIDKNLIAAMPGGHHGPLHIPRPLMEWDERDWSYRTIAQSLELVREFLEIRIEPVDKTEPDDPGSVCFLRALLRGGAQGALYFLETQLNS